MAQTTPETSSEAAADLCPDLEPGPAPLAFVTPCSAEKYENGGKIPAIERYAAPRIRRVEAAARKAGADFLIFSGRFGLLDAATPIPLYDHLLLAEEVEAHAARVARQLRQRELDRVLCFSEGVEADPKLAPYLACLEEACERAAVAITFLGLEG